MLTAKPDFQSTFPRRNRTVLANEVPIGEVTLTGWGTGVTVLRGQHYFTTTAPAVGPVVPNYPTPRHYTMYSDIAPIHSALEDPSRIYCIESSSPDRNLPIIFRQTNTWKQRLFEPWPRYGVFRSSDGASCGTIIWRSPRVWQSAFGDLVALTLLPEIGETLQFFLLWLFVDRAQWGRDEDAG